MRTSEGIENGEYRIQNEADAMGARIPARRDRTSGFSHERFVDEDL